MSLASFATQYAGETHTIDDTSIVFRAFQGMGGAACHGGHDRDHPDQVHGGCRRSHDLDLCSIQFNRAGVGRCHHQPYDMAMGLLSQVSLTSSVPAWSLSTAECVVAPYMLSAIAFHLELPSVSWFSPPFPLMQSRSRPRGGQFKALTFSELRHLSPAVSCSYSRSSQAGYSIRGTAPPSWRPLLWQASV